MDKSVEVIIHLQRLMDLDEILIKVKRLKEENPHVIFHIEVNF